MDNPDQLIDRALQEEVFPGIAVQVEQKGKLIYKKVAGYAGVLNGREPLGEHALFDLASLTKPLATAVVLLHILDQEHIQAGEALGRFLPGCGQDIAGLEFRDLLLHTAGLPPVPEMFRLFHSGDTCSRGQAVNHILNIRLSGSPGKEMIYSCTGYILLGLAAEALGGAPLNKLFERIIMDGRSDGDLLYTPDSSDRDRAVTEEFDPWRNRWLKGEVHDENAWTLGGISGNAGLFGTLKGVCSLMELFRSHGYLKGRRILDDEVIRNMTTAGNPSSTGAARAYGFACNDTDFFTGPGFSKQSYGHTGFTGTSVLFDPARDLKVVILTNRVHYGRDNTAEKNRDFRRSFHRLFL